MAVWEFKSRIPRSDSSPLTNPLCLVVVVVGGCTWFLEVFQRGCLDGALLAVGRRRMRPRLLLFSCLAEKVGREAGKGCSLPGLPR